MSPGATPLAADPDPSLSPGASAYSVPPLTLTEPAKEKVTAVATTPLLGPRQAVLESTPLYSGPILAGLDETGAFLLAVLVEKRAREQLQDVSLLRSSVEYSLQASKREVMTLKKELDAAKGWDFLLRSSVSVPFFLFFSGDRKSVV